ncbi:hypothetical protein Vretimale_10223, partial [Volvox reticuliferus]
ESQTSPAGRGSGGEASLGSTLRQELHRRVEGMLWTRHTTPPEWSWEGVVLPSRVRPPQRQTTCLLEADAVVHDIANRREAVRTRLEAATPSQQLLVSLLPMWQEERVRGGGVLPERPRSPPRSPGPLCPAVEAVRQELRSVAEYHLQLLDERRRREEQEAANATAIAAAPAAGAAGAGGGDAAAAGAPHAMDRDATETTVAAEGMVEGAAVAAEAVAREGHALPIGEMHDVQRGTVGSGADGSVAGSSPIQPFYLHLGIGAP